MSNVNYYVAVLILAAGAVVLLSGGELRETFSRLISPQIKEAPASTETTCVSQADGKIIYAACPQP